MKRLAGALALLLLLASPVLAQGAWPTKPVRFVVPFPPGGTTDILARFIGDGLSRALGQQFVIDNRAGAGGNVGTDIVAHAPADGYTIVMMTPGPVSINQFIYKSLSFDPDKDLVAVSLVARVANVLAVNPNVPARTIDELIAYAKANPGRINYATPGNGSTGHLSTELFKSMAGIDLTHIPYKGSGPALNDLIAGQVQMTIDNLPSALAHIKAGSLRALGVTSEKRSASLPDVPAIAEVVKNYEASSWFAVMAPAGTPKEIVDKMSATIDDLLRTDDMKRRFADVGAEPVGGTPAYFAAHILAERAKWQKVVELSGAKLD